MYVGADRARAAAGVVRVDARLPAETQADVASRALVEPPAQDEGVVGIDVEHIGLDRAGRELLRDLARGLVGLVARELERRVGADVEERAQVHRAVEGRDLGRTRRRVLADQHVAPVADERELLRRARERQHALAALRAGEGGHGGRQLDE